MSSSIIPVTANPYFGSLSSILCPPIIVHPAWFIICKPPFRTSESMSNDKSSLGHETSCKAESGFPPIAYISDRAFAAATLPQSKGSSSIGVKKSTVCIILIPLWSSITPPSSGVSRPTSILWESDVFCCLKCFSTWASSFWESLHAQPAPWEYSVSLT